MKYVKKSSSPWCLGTKALPVALVSLAALGANVTDSPANYTAGKQEAGLSVVSQIDSATQHPYMVWVVAIGLLAPVFWLILKRWPNIRRYVSAAFEGTRKHLSEQSQRGAGVGGN